MPRMPRLLRRWLRGIVILVAMNACETAYRDRHPLFALGQLPPGLGGLPRRRPRGDRRRQRRSRRARSNSSRSSAIRKAISTATPPAAQTSSRNSGARHIIGCVTSWSRKEVIPVLEKAGGTLWYACPYEGFEANEHVVYMHACPNQHLVPLLGYVVPRFGANGFLLGLQLHLGLGDQPRRPRPDRRCRRQGAGRALSAARRGRRVAADRRDPRRRGRTSSSTI